MLIEEVNITTDPGSPFTHIPLVSSAQATSYFWCATEFQIRQINKSSGPGKTEIIILGIEYP
jgi:hypothetical protein